MKEIFKNIGGKTEKNDGAIVGASAFHLWDRGFYSRSGPKYSCKKSLSTLY
jgi:hypothetical protein